MDRPPCDACPLSGDGVPCVARVTGHRPFCDWAKAGGARRARVVELSRGGTPIVFADPPPRPGPLRQAASLAGSVVAAARSGFRTVSPGEQGRRLSICHGCAFFTDGRCQKCGCFLAYKTRLEAWHCPLNLW